MRPHRYAVGLPVSYVEDLHPRMLGGAATRLSTWSLAETGSPSIRSGAPTRAMTGSSGESQLQEDPGVGTMRLNGHVIRFPMSQVNSAKSES